MKISTKGRYALRVMLDIAHYGGNENVSLKEISAREGISVKYLEQIVAQLGKLGLLKSVRGTLGGYRLARLPKEYTVGEILRVTEGSLAPVACLDSDRNECERYLECPTIKVWEGLYEVINKYVDSITLEDLLEKQSQGNDFII